MPFLHPNPVVAVHLCAALAALLIGPVALWARRGAVVRPRLHRMAGYMWVGLMLVAAVSAMLIRDFRVPNIAGYGFIHLLVPVTLAALARSFWLLRHRDIAGHRAIMQRLYVGACGVAGGFTLLPQRYLGRLLWGHLGLL